MLAHSVTDEPIVLESDIRSEDGDDNFDTTHGLRTLDGDQPGHGALNLELLSTPFNPSADKAEYGDNDIDNNTSPRLAKRQRSASPRSELNLRHTSTSPLISSKRQKLSAPLGVETTLNGYSRQSRHSLSPSSEDDEDEKATGLGAYLQKTTSLTLPEPLLPHLTPLPCRIPHCVPK
jgi:hypothetical protein